MLINYEELINEALECGFTSAGNMDVNSAIIYPEVRDMCAADKCKRYDKNWMCPPACGSLENNIEIKNSYKKGIIVQTTRKIEDDFDFEGMEAAGQDHMKYFYFFTKLIRAKISDTVALGAGGCTLCEKCTYPDKPCVRPDEAVVSMEAFGLFVSEICKQNGLKYYYGPQTITYTGCFFIE